MRMPYPYSESCDHLDVAPQNENEILVDALPYLDREYDNPTIRDRVDRCLPCLLPFLPPFPHQLVRGCGISIRHHDVAESTSFPFFHARPLPFSHLSRVWRSLVEAEMGNFKPRDYLGSLPPVPPVSLPKESLLWKEFERIKADPSSKLGGIDLAKYEPAAPSGKEAKDPKAWKEALDRAHTALEHTNIRSVLP